MHVRGRQLRVRTALVAVALLLVCGALPASADETTTFGRQGDPASVSRTIDLEVDDHLRYKPGEITVRQDETIRFRVKNSGRHIHGLALGTMTDLKEHARSMRAEPDMQQDESHTVRVAPGASETLVWQFTKAGEFHYGCLVPGHLEAGMIGKINVVPK